MRQATLTIAASGQPSTVLELAGEWAPGPNRDADTGNNDFEPSLAQISATFGWTTDIGGNGALDWNKSNYAFGDETLAPFGRRRTRRVR